MSPETRYKIERAKDKTPTTSHFLWLVPLFLLACWLGKSDSSKEAAQWVNQYAVKESPLRGPSYADYSRYPDGGPVCGGEVLCILGWRL